MQKLDGGSVSPAYGRDYKSGREAREAFESGKDFVLHHPLHPTTYCSIRDFAPGATVQVRYKKMSAVLVVRVK